MKKWFSYEVLFEKAPLEHVDKHVLTFTAYVFTVYSIDEKPAISSFKELSCLNVLFFQHYKDTKINFIFKINQCTLLKNKDLSKL